MDHYETFRRADSDEKRAALIAGMTEDERAAVLALAETEAATLGAFDDPERLPSAVIAAHKAREGRP